MNENGILFSVVVPVYNVERYLKECIDSIVNQGKCFEGDYEIILVNDGSTDNSGEICDEYRDRYPKLIKAFHKSNEGLLLTRRFGFNRAMGEYIINCDSDDLLENNALATLEKAIFDFNFPDCLLYNYYSYDGENKESKYKNIFCQNEIVKVNKTDVYREFLLTHSIVSMCVKCFKKKCLNLDMDYSSYRSQGNGEDTLQSIEIFDNADSFIYLNRQLYSYRSGSGMTGKFDENYFETFCKVFKQIEIRKDTWNLPEFDELFSVKLLSTAGRAITQSRYKQWKRVREHVEYLKCIRENEMFCNYAIYLKDTKNYLQRDYVILLRLLDSRKYLIIVILLRIKDLMSK